MADHNEHSCYWCGSLLHPDDKCAKKPEHPKPLSPPAPPPDKAAVAEALGLKPEHFDIRPERPELGSEIAKRVGRRAALEAAIAEIVAITHGYEKTIPYCAGLEGQAVEAVKGFKQNALMAYEQRDAAAKAKAEISAQLIETADRLDKAAQSAEDRLRLIGHLNSALASASSAEDRAAQKLGEFSQENERLKKEVAELKSEAGTWSGAVDDMREEVNGLRAGAEDLERALDGLAEKDEPGFTYQRAARALIRLGKNGEVTGLGSYRRALTQRDEKITELENKIKDLHLVAVRAGAHGLALPQYKGLNGGAIPPHVSCCAEAHPLKIDGKPAHHEGVECSDADEALASCKEDLATAKHKNARLTQRLAEAEPTGSVLLEAEKIVNGPRRASYGEPRVNHGRTATFWQTYLIGRGWAPPKFGGVERPLDGHDVCQLNVLQKISRDCHSRKRDNLTDQAGFTENARLCDEPEVSS